MASHDVLSLSLDDIIKMKGRKRSSNSRGRGQKSAGHQDRGMSHSSRGLGRGRAWGQGWGRTRGSRILSPKFTVQRAGIRAAGRDTPVRSKGIPGLGRGQAGLGRNRGGLLNGWSRGVWSGRGVRGGSQEQRGRGGIAGRGRGRGSLRGRGSIAILRRGRGGITQRASTTHPQLVRQNSQQNITARDSSFRQRLARRKIQQARKTLVLSQQNNRAKARLGIVNAMRGIQEEQIKPVRGAGSMRGAGSVVSLSSQHGLTVSIKNNIASSQIPHPGSSMKARPKLNRSRIRQYPTTSYTPTMFTVVNDQAIPPELPVAGPPPPRKILKRSVTSARDTRAGVASPVMVYPQQNSRPVPEPHRQILDPKVQKEIAMLQGKEVSLNSGPGPGVKGFRHIPSHTARSLNERFTEERMITT
ncbi:uncharacterized protein LOC123515132 isoform X2 [Portunus trituberculatus]|uniref:uncharacterized protein LOC123515132 isoform X2 n=1 Tax=Portunus trituberculatus TaxID=210409 RepID=UPI001E1D16A8|nr:uncharacterized protein LOC123515132 isoform X2 [Portunus trituberculatus]